MRKEQRAERGHSVEKIGGTSMSDYSAVRDNIICSEGASPYGRVFVVSAYGGVTDRLLEHKRSGEPGIYKLFAAASPGTTEWLDALDGLRSYMCSINARLFDGDSVGLARADAFLARRLDALKQVLLDLHRVCSFGHFQLEEHLHKVREMLASLGEAQSAFNTVALLQRDGISARLVDLTGWDDTEHLPLDEKIAKAFADLELDAEVPIVTGYAHCREGLMRSFDRGYSEMTFSRVAVLTGAREAVIHKEYHLSSADPRIVGADAAVPIGRTNYDVADQLANVGMEAIHPMAAKGLRKACIPLRVRNTFEPEHDGTLITHDYSSTQPCVEIITGMRKVFALQLFDQEMSGRSEEYDHEIIAVVRRFGARTLTKELNANTICHYLDSSLKNLKRIVRVLEEGFPEASVEIRKLSLVSIIGSHMQVPGILASAVNAFASAGVNVISLHQCLRQVDIQCVVEEDDYEPSIRALHAALVEPHEHDYAIRVA